MGTQKIASVSILYDIMHVIYVHDTKLLLRLGLSFCGSSMQLDSTLAYILHKRIMTHII